jgi:hypothetical protein
MCLSFIWLLESDCSLQDGNKKDFVFEKTLQTRHGNEMRGKKMTGVNFETVNEFCGDIIYRELLFFLLNFYLLC